MSMPRTMQAPHLSGLLAKKVAIITGVTIPIDVGRLASGA